MFDGLRSHQTRCLIEKMLDEMFEQFQTFIQHEIVCRKIPGI